MAIPPPRADCEPTIPRRITLSIQPQGLVRRLIEAINRRDYGALHDLVDPEYV